jgi:hypothetical protein
MQLRLLTLSVTFALAGLGGLLGPGCGKTVYRSHEAQYCSTDDNEDPFYECSPAFNLVCATTHSEALQNTPDGGQRVFVDRYTCRLACDPGDRCPVGTDICCPAKNIVGRDYGKNSVCVPEPMCQTITPGDGGVDARPDRFSTIDSPGEAGTGDVPAPGDAADAASGAEAGVDAAAPVDAGDGDAAGG